MAERYDTDSDVRPRMSERTVQDRAEADADRPGETVAYREIGHDEFDPIGTLTLIGLYLLVLVLAWLFVYFVEFLGNGPTVVGTVAAGVTLG